MKTPSYHLRSALRLIGVVLVTLVALVVLTAVSLGCANAPTDAFESLDAALTSAEAAVIDLPSAAAVGAGDDVGNDDDDAATDDAGQEDALPIVELPPDDAAAPPPGPPFDAGPDGVCGAPPAAGDLQIVEVMIESVAGTGDYAQWLEVLSTRDCALDLRGLTGECPVGAKVATFELEDDLWLPARGSFVVADSSDPIIDHDLPGTLVTWSGVADDVLRKSGSTVTLVAQGVIVDSVTWPALKLVVGASMAFPADCPASLRTDWTKWQPSSASWFPGFYGTPNAPNVDVRCPDILEWSHDPFADRPGPARPRGRRRGERRHRGPFARRHRHPLPRG